MENIWGFQNLANVCFYLLRRFFIEVKCRSKCCTSYKVVIKIGVIKAVCSGLLSPENANTHLFEVCPIEFPLEKDGDAKNLLWVLQSCEKITFETRNYKYHRRKRKIKSSDILPTNWPIFVQSQNPDGENLETFMRKRKERRCII